MGRTCSQNEEEKNACKILTCTHTGKRLRGRPKCKRQDNIRMDLKKIGVRNCFVSARNRLLEGPYECVNRHPGPISHGAGNTQIGESCREKCVRACGLDTPVNLRSAERDWALMRSRPRPRRYDESVNPFKTSHYQFKYVMEQIYGAARGPYMAIPKPICKLPYL